jgi:DNA ligase-1
MLFGELAAISARVGETRSRLAKIGLLRDCLRRLRPDEAAMGAAFLSGIPRQGRIGVGPARVEQAFRTLAAERSNLTLCDTDQALERIKATSGPGSAGVRAQQLVALGARATVAEQRFLASLLLGELRQGALEGVLIEALAQAADLPVGEVRRAIMLAGDLPRVAQAVLGEGQAGLNEFRIEILRPVQPMLAQAANNVDDALDRIGEAALEYKLDGARVQVHKAGEEVRVFTRRLSEVTAALPELVEQVAALPARELILDGETLALRPEGMPYPFQTTMRRFGRRLDVTTLCTELPLSVFFFDLLYGDGESLIDRPGRERWQALCDTVPEPLRIPRRVTDDAYSRRSALGTRESWRRALEPPTRRAVGAAAGSK